MVDLCFSCKHNLDKHTKDELWECAFDIVKGERET